MHIKYGIALVIILLVAVFAIYNIFLGTGLSKNQSMPHALNVSQNFSTTAYGQSSFTQQFCLNAAYNITAMDIAISNSIKCFRTDITMGVGEQDFISNTTRLGAVYLGILDYDTVGAQPSRYGCVSGCNWTLNTWNASISYALSKYPEVHEWEIYNEPLISMFASGYEDGNATHYFNMIKSAYLLIKHSNPNATVVCFGGAELYPISTVSAEYAFYRQVWAEGASKYCDAISLHVYSLPFYSLSQDAYGNATLGQVYNYTLNLYENLTGKPVWITETGIPSNNWIPAVNLSEAKQSEFLTEDLSFFASYGFVKRIYWFHLVGGAGGPDYGLLNETTLAQKPAWYAFLHFVDNSISNP